jgi:hypothetical protein
VGETIDFVNYQTNDPTCSAIGAVYGTITLVPEPSSLLLLAAGLPALLAYAWRKRR